MPELPEVETVRRGLEKILVEKPVVEDVRFHRRDIRDPIPTKKIRAMVGQPITSVERRGKYLLFRTPAGFLLSHLGMTGSWRAAAQSNPKDHDHFEIHFGNRLKLVYRDPRRFGILDWGQDPRVHPRLATLGPEPFAEEFNSESLWQALHRRAAPVKNILMDPEVVVGVGNIYASEVLFRAGLRPSRPGRRLTKSECAKLPPLIRDVLGEAIEAGGSSISDYVQANGESGDFQSRFRVYDREGQPCVVCGHSIRRQVLGGRSSFFCSKCQR